MTTRNRRPTSLPLGPWITRATLAAGLASLTGCVSSERVATLETRLAETESRLAASDESWRERLAASERREERLRVELARLQRAQRRAEETLKAEVARHGNVAACPAGGIMAPAGTRSGTAPLASNDAAASSPAPPAAAATPATPATAKAPGPTPVPATLAAPSKAPATFAEKLAAFYASGKLPEPAFLEEPGEPSLRPRASGRTGVDGDHLVGRPLGRTRFLSSTGDSVDLADLLGKKTVVLTILRGFEGSVCVACSAQTLALAERLDEFERRGAAVYLVYPGKVETVPRFLDAVRELSNGGAALPLEVLLDVDLAAVNEFKIEGALARPTTLVIDKLGIVRFAHVGKSIADRPGVPKLLEVLDGLK